MSQDPNQPPTGYGSDPQNPYGTPPQGPYGTQNPYGEQSNPYQSQGAAIPPQYPPQPGYNMQPQGQYAVPPANGFAFTNQGYGDPNQVPLTPLPLGEAIRQLPSQYIHVFTHPAKSTFDEEIRKASWDITWIQIVIMAVGSALISLIYSLILNATGALTASTSAMTSSLSFIGAAAGVGGALLQIITVPIGFFIGVGIQYLLARAFKGQGTFLGQAYTSLLYQVPYRLLATLLGALLGLIPVVGVFINIPVALIIGIYSIVLNVFQIQSSHRLSGGKATWVVLIPWIALIVLAVLCSVLFVAIIAAALKGAAGSTP
ncbi:MAG TPA: YIP1 family protein [Ktedonobacteraceae bacterium]|nr:YIP1 family protein [Ktedonobacteraceae bacterium]